MSLFSSDLFSSGLDSGGGGGCLLGSHLGGGGRGGGSGSGSSGRRLGSVSYLSLRGGLVRLRKPRAVDLARRKLLLGPCKHLLHRLVTLLPLRELLQDGSVLREPLDLLEQVAEVGNLGHALRAAVLLDQLEGGGHFGELERGGRLRDDLLHLLDCLRVRELA